VTQTQTTMAVYTVKSGDTLFDIGQRLSIPWQKIAEVNNLTDPDHIDVGQKLKLPGNKFKSLTVKSGDTLNAISERLSKNVTNPADKKKLSVNALGQINNIQNLDLIHPGETIIYPNVPGTP
jgi:LysM repeat protein